MLRMRHRDGSAALALFAVVLAAAVVPGCATNPVTGESNFVLINESQESALGAQYAPEITQEYGGRYPDEALQAYVSEVGRKIAAISHRPNVKFTFTLLDSDQVNAFALPGGPVFITKELLGRMSNEAQLAGVFGHEVGHVTARHGVQQMSQAMGAQAILKVLSGAAGSAELAQVGGAMFGLAQKGYGRDHEFESDRLGVDYSVKAGYNPIGVVQLLEILQSLHEQEPSAVEEWFMTHPLTSRRIDQAHAEIDKRFPGATRDPNLLINAERFMAKTERVRAEVLRGQPQKKTEKQPTR